MYLLVSLPRLNIVNHVFVCTTRQDVDGRNKSGHDVESLLFQELLRDGTQSLLNDLKAKLNRLAGFLAGFLERTRR
jgi:hypothetical protein